MRGLPMNGAAAPGRVLARARALGYAAGGRRLVAGADLELRAGALTVIVGPNGAGKSTLLRLLAGELTPQEGEALYDGVSVRAEPAWRLACRRAVMSQQPQVGFSFTAREVVRLGADGVGRARPRAALEALVEAAMADAGVRHLAGRDFHSLSGGEQQRVHFARALAQLEAGASVSSDRILFLDEPTASLDLNHQLALLDRTREIVAGGVAALAVLHDLNLACAYADWLAAMRDGAVVAQGPPQEVMTDALLREVFGVDLRLGVAPADGRPFVLPHARRAQG